MVDTMALWWDGHDESLSAALAELQNTILKSLDGLISQVKGMFSRYCLEMNLLFLACHINICF
jgi:hypothetical protein